MLVVNKRCVTVQNGSGDLRTLRFYLNSSYFTAFKNWELKDILTGDKYVFTYNEIASWVYFPHVF